MYSKELFDALNIGLDILVDIEFTPGTGGEYYIGNYSDKKVKVIAKQDKDGPTYGGKDGYYDWYPYAYIKSIDVVEKK